VQNFVVANGFTMNNPLPSLIHYSTLVHPSKTLQDEINRHTLAIHKTCFQKKALGNILYDCGFWQQRIQAQPHLQDLYNTWLRIKPLAHLNSQDLISLYQMHLEPLKRLYQYYGAQQNDPIVLKTINTNLKRIKQLRIALLEGLYFRAQIYKTFNQKLEVEDVYRYFFKKLNIPIRNALSSTLSHDLRIVIYDLLSEKSNVKNFTKDTLYQKILQDLPQRGYAPLTTLKNSVLELEHFNQSRQKKLDKLNITQLSKSQRIAKIQKRSLSIKQKLSILMGALTVSGLLYAGIVFFLQPYLMVILGQSLFQLTNQALFFTIPFAPLYWFVISTAKSSIEYGIHKLCSYKVNDLLKALLDLEQSHLFIHQTLSHPIIDLKHFDAKQLLKNYQELLDTLDSDKAKLKKTNILQRLFHSNTIVHETHKAIVNIEKIKTKLQDRFFTLSEHLADRIGKEIKSFDYSATNQCLMPALSLNQLKSITKLIRKFGNEKTQQTLNDNTNVVKLWMNQMAIGHFQVTPLQTSSYYQKPWGKRDIAHASLNGWRRILENYILCESQRKAALTILDVLMDKISLSTTQLHQCFECLNLDARQMKAIDTFIFETLDSRKIEHVRLLDKDSRKCLLNWKKENILQLNAATAAMRDIFSHSNPELFQRKLEQYNLDELSKFNELYEINRRIEVLGNRPLTDSMGAERYFKHYDGSQSFAHLLINFLPPSQRRATLHRIAQKRLGWILENLEHTDLHFDQFDGDLFLSLELFEENGFNFKEQVKQSQAFKTPKNPAMIKFLEACTEHGFDNKSLLLQYQKSRNVIGMHSKNPRCIPKADDFSVRRQESEAPGAYALVRDRGERAKPTTPRIHLRRV